MAEKYITLNNLKTFLSNLKERFTVGVKGNAESSYRHGNVNITAENIGLGNLTNNKQINGLSSGTTRGHMAVWGDDGYTLQDGGEVPSVITMNEVYPVGSIYMSVNSTNPSNLFGGTWEQIKDTFLLSAGDTFIAGATGGEAEHTLTVDELPSHNHKLPNRDVIYNKGGGSGLSSSGNYSLNTNVGANVDNTGGGQAHNNMPPYLAVYMWKRTA